MRPPTPNDSTHYACPPSEPCASSAATSPGRRVFPLTDSPPTSATPSPRSSPAPTPPDDSVPTPASPNEPAAPSSPESASTTTTSGTDRHPKSDSPACKVNGIVHQTRNGSSPVRPKQSSTASRNRRCESLETSC